MVCQWCSLETMIDQGQESYDGLYYVLFLLLLQMPAMDSVLTHLVFTGYTLDPPKWMNECLFLQKILAVHLANLCFVSFSFVIFLFTSFCSQLHANWHKCSTCPTSFFWEKKESCSKHLITSSLFLAKTIH